MVSMAYRNFVLNESSTCLEQTIEYNETGGWLRVQFTDGTTWTYGPGVGINVVVDLMMATSVGRFFNAFIRDVY